MMDSLPTKALYLCNGENRECEKTNCALLGLGECSRTTNVIYAKNGPVVNFKEWAKRFEVLPVGDEKIYYEKDESSDE